MTWPLARLWIDGMNSARYLGYDDWRLPATLPIDGNAYDTTYSNNATTDFGYADREGWIDGAGSPVSEMGHLYYVTLANTGACPPNDAMPALVCSRSRNPPRNRGSFLDLQGGYWSGSELNAEAAWSFDFDSGYQDTDPSGDRSGGCGRGGCGGSPGTELHAWAVRDGDVSPVPEPSAFWLFGSGILTLLAMPRGRRRLLATRATTRIER